MITPIIEIEIKGTISYYVYNFKLIKTDGDQIFIAKKKNSLDDNCPYNKLYTADDIMAENITYRKVINRWMIDNLFQSNIELSKEQTEMISEFLGIKDI